MSILISPSLQRTGVCVAYIHKQRPLFDYEEQAALPVYDICDDSFADYNELVPALLCPTCVPHVCARGIQDR
eukprot:COSAG05_NODE_2293_length_3266_cov_456.310073_5_plen_72_part_00